MKKATTAFLMLVLALVSQISFAQTADDVIKKYFDAMGGADKWKSVKDVTMNAKLKVPSQGLDLAATMYQKGPNKQKMVLNFQGKEIVQPSFDGKEGWQTNFMTMKAEKMEAEDNEILKNELDFPDPFLDYQSKGYAVALDGEETIDGVACHKIKLTKKPVKIDGKEEENFSYYFFDKDNGALVMSRSFGKKGPMKGMATESFMSDYQEVNGMMFPFTITQKVNGQVGAVIAIEKVLLNTNIDDKIFAFPTN